MAKKDIVKENDRSLFEVCRANLAIASPRGFKKAFAGSGWRGFLSSTLKKAVFSLQTKSQKNSFKKNPVYKKDRKSEFLLTKVGKWGIEIDFKRARKIEFLLTEFWKNMLFSSFFGGFQGPREPFFTFWPLKNTFLLTEFWKNRGNDGVSHFLCVSPYRILRKKSIFHEKTVKSAPGNLPTFLLCRFMRCFFGQGLLDGLFKNAA